MTARRQHTLGVTNIANNLRALFILLTVFTVLITFSGIAVPTTAAESSSAQQVTVSPEESIEKAAEQVGPGGTVVLESGVHQESPEIETPQITLTSTSDAVIEGGINIYATGATVESIEIRSGDDGIFAEGSLTVRDVEINNVRNTGIRVQASTGSAVEISKTDVSGSEENGIRIQGGNEITLADITVQNTDDDGIQINSGPVRDQSISATNIELAATGGFDILQGDFRPGSVALSSVSVVDAYNGIYAEVGSSITAEDIEVNDATNTGLWVDASTDTTVEVSNAQISQVGDDGDEENGIRIQGGSEVTLADISVQDTDGEGIQISAGPVRSQNISASNIELAGTSGFDILQGEFRPGSVTLSGISVTDAYNGIYTEVESSFTAENIEISDVTNTGIWVDASSETNVGISGVDINGVNGDGDERQGIRVQGGSEITLAEITAQNTDYGGIAVFSGPVRGQSVSATNIELAGTNGFYILQGEGEFKPGSITLGSVSVTGGYYGISVDVESSFTAENVQINDVDNAGIWADASTDTAVRISSAEISGVGGSDEEEHGVIVRGSSESELADITVRDANDGIVFENIEQEPLGKTISLNDIELSSLEDVGVSIHTTTGSDRVEVTGATVSDAPDLGFGMIGAEGTDRLSIEDTVISNSGDGFYFGTIEEVQLNRVNAESIEGERLVLEGTSRDDVTAVNSFEEFSDSQDGAEGGTQQASSQNNGGGLGVGWTDAVSALLVVAVGYIVGKRVVGGDESSQSSQSSTSTSGSSRSGTGSSQGNSGGTTPNQNDGKPSAPGASGSGSSSTTIDPINPGSSGSGSSSGSNTGTPDSPDSSGSSGGASNTSFEPIDPSESGSDSGSSGDNIAEKSTSFDDDDDTA